MSAETSNVPPLKNVFQYLKSRGWKQLGHPNERIAYFESPHDESGDFHSIVLPTSDGFADNGLRIVEALETIACAEKSTPRDVAYNLNKWDKDIFRARLFSDVGQVNSLPLSLATDVLDELKAFFGFAAYTHLEPKKFFPKTGRVGSDFIQHCRFGHTFEGSFGLCIECPIQSAGQMAFDGSLAEAPFERQVMERIARGYRDLNASLDSGNPSRLLEGYTAGFNANMLESLSTIFEKLDHLSVTYDVDWAPEIAPAVTAIIDKPIKFDQRAYELSTYAAKELIKEDTVDRTVIVSYVLSLESEHPLTAPQDSFEHLITLSWERSAGVSVRITVPLPTDEYRRACDAHKYGRRIAIEGIPIKHGKFWFLGEVSEFRYDV